MTSKVMAFFSGLLLLLLFRRASTKDHFKTVDSNRSMTTRSIGRSAPLPPPPRPPMGWMSWERFRCQTDCVTHSTECINEDLYRTMTDLLVSDGYLEAGYNTISIDDCWMAKDRDTKTGRQVADPDRFPSGIRSLADYMHERGVQLGIYSDEGTLTCEGYPGSLGYEDVDARTYAEWGVDYLKLDGCNNNPEKYQSGYTAMGNSLQQQNRNITYSCSWPAYIGDDETAKPYGEIRKAGCHLWRNWRDVANRWESVAGIIEHFGTYSKHLATQSGVGLGWNDLDEILVGSDHFGTMLSIGQAQVQMSIWSILASPLIMSNDLRTVPAEYREILLNPEVIAVNQDALGRPGWRMSISEDGSQQVWARALSNGQLAIVMYNSSQDADKYVSVDLQAVTMEFLGFLWTDGARVRDVFARAELVLPQPVDSITASVPPTSCRFLVARASEEPTEVRI